MMSGKKLILDWLKFTSNGLSCLVFFYIFIAHLVNIVTPTEKYIDQRVFDPTYLRYLLLLAFILGLISWIIYVLQKKISFISPLSYDRLEKFYYLTTAFFLAIFYIGIFAEFKLFQYVFFCLLLVLFYVFVPQLTQLYLSFDAGEFKSLIFYTHAFFKKHFALSQLLKTLKLIALYIVYRFRKPPNHLERTIHIGKQLKKALVLLISKLARFLLIIGFILVSSFVIFFTLFYIVLMVNNYIQGNIYRENLKRRQFFITKIVPQKALRAHQVELGGYHFGWKIEGDPRYRVMTSDGPIRLIEEWTNEKIKIIIPLEMESGKKEIWIERPNDDQNNPRVVKSNSAAIYIFSRFYLYPAANDTLLQRITKRIKRLIYFRIPILGDLMLPE